MTEANARVPAHERMPVLFVGHGSPLNAIADNEWSRALTALGRALPRPKAILAVSAHGYGETTFVTAGERPPTIHDFGGFPQALHEVRYPAPGDPALAARVQALLGSDAVAARTDAGFDHGTWSVLVHLFPDASVPVVQLGIDAALAPRDHTALGARLLPLRGERVLVLGSGNVTHNLRDAMPRMASSDTATPPWAARFDTAVAGALRARDADALLRLPDTPDGRLAHPTPDHWLPLLYAFAASDRDDPLTFPIEGFDLGSLSMRAVRWG